MMSEKTGNIYFEIAEKSDPNNKNYVQSGIFRKDNTISYLIGTENYFFLIKKAALQKYYQNNSHQLNLKTISTSKGFILKKSELIEIFQQDVIFFNLRKKDIIPSTIDKTFFNIKGAK